MKLTGKRNYRFRCYGNHDDFTCAARVRLDYEFIGNPRSQQFQP